MRQDDVPSRRRRLVPLAAVCAAGLLAAACQGSSAGGPSGSGSGKPAAPSVRLSITPATGSTGASPSSGITVTASGGKLKTVNVTGAGLTGTAAVTGTLNAAATSWHSNWTLPVSSTITVTATAADPSGRTLTQSSTFKTLAPA
ncbi:MAG TPA: Ig-like domain-containing protein, partial [Streptosporangiaceae bacterium]